MSKTTSGFEYEIDERIKKDWDFLEAVTRLQKEPSDWDNQKKLYVMLLGEKGFEDLKEHVRKLNDGFCDSTALTKELAEIVKGDNTVKKS